MCTVTRDLIVPNSSKGARTFWFANEVHCDYWALPIQRTSEQRRWQHGTTIRSQTHGARVCKQSALSKTNGKTCSIAAAQKSTINEAIGPHVGYAFAKCKDQTVIIQAPGFVLLPSSAHCGSLDQGSPHLQLQTPTPCPPSHIPAMTCSHESAKTKEETLYCDIPNAPHPRTGTRIRAASAIQGTGRQISVTAA